MPLNAAERITPAWLRPITYGAVIVLHAAVVVGMPWPTAPEQAVSAPLTIEVVPQGDTADTLIAPDQVQVAESPASEAQTVDSQPSEAKEVETAPAKQARDDRDEIAEAKPDTRIAEFETKELERVEAKPPEAKPIEAKPMSAEPLNTRPAEVKPVDGKPIETTKPTTQIVARQVTAEPVTLLPVPAVRPVERPTRTVTAVEPPRPAPPTRVETREEPAKHYRRKREAKETRASAAASRAASRAGSSAQASLNAGAAASANYRSLVVAELNRHKFYPPSARSAGVRGVVVVTFTIGSSGRVTRHSISRSSGQSVLDNAVHQMMASVSLPPPPGGSFHASAPIRFDISN